MPLAPRSLIDHWYSRSSFVYRSFAFLFSNPLWQRSVPQGFSLCPMFWMSLFSLFILRPFVYTCLGIFAVVKLLHLERLIPFTDRVSKWVLSTVFGLDTRDVVFMPSCLLFLFVGFGGLWCAVIGANYYVAGLMPLLLIPLSNAFVLFRCFVYSGSCKVEVYPRVTLLVSVAALASLYPSDFVTSFVHYPIAGFLGAVYGIWAGLVWLAVTFKTILFWLGAMAVGGAAAFFLTLGAFAIVGWLGWFVTRNQGYATGPRVDSKERRAIVEQLADIVWGTDFLYPFTKDMWRGIMRDMPEVSWFTSLAQTDDTTKVEAFKAAAMKRGEIEWQKMSAENQAKAERKARRDAACARVSARISALFAPLEPVAHNVAVFIAYMWALAKAFKSKSCPYQRFTD